MPKVKYFDPSGEQAFLTRLTASHGEFVSMAELCRMLGFKSYQALYAWLKDNDVPEFTIGKNKRYETAVIAEKLWETRT